MSTLDLFPKKSVAHKRLHAHAPLAERMRPRRLIEVVGQEHLLGEGQVLSSTIGRGQLHSMVIWGPPGCGKTTLARVIAAEVRAHFEHFSAVLGGVKELREIVLQAVQRAQRSDQRTILFIDEIHRFNKGQQDALLPHVEAGTLTLIGATTENPSFAVIPALLSRTAIFALTPLTVEQVGVLLRRAIADRTHGLGQMPLTFLPECVDTIARHCRGDARRALDILDAAAHHALQHGHASIDNALLTTTLASATLLHDKKGEAHYNVISAFIKSMRGSDPDAAIYWMMRMLEAGDDPLFLLRRMMIFASEDIGNADPNALQVAVAADTAFQRIGMPEGIYPLAHCCIYLACAPKSNACYKAFTEAKADIQRHGSLAVPHKLRNAVTAYMKESGYGEGYRYPPNEGGYAAGETYLPDSLIGRRYYRPTEQGYEAQVKAFLARLKEE